MQPAVAETQEKKMTSFRKATRWLLIGLGAAALGSPASQAATRPDDRAGARGIEAQQAVSTNRPDDRAGIHGIGQSALADQTDALSRYIANNTPAVRADDRAGWHGAGPNLAAPLAMTAPIGTSSHDFGLGALLGAATMLAALAAAYTGRNHIHRPHLPIHSH